MSDRIVTPVLKFVGIANNSGSNSNNNKKIGNNNTRLKTFFGKQQPKNTNKAKLENNLERKRKGKHLPTPALQ